MESRGEPGHITEPSPAGHAEASAGALSSDWAVVGGLAVAFAAVLLVGCSPRNTPAAARAASPAEVAGGSAAAAPDSMGGELGAEAEAIASVIAAEGGSIEANTEVVAVIAFLQQLGAPAVDANPLPGPAEDDEVVDAALLADVPALATRGQALFARYCAACHGPDGRGHVGPDLSDAEWRFGGRPSQLLHSVALGHPERGMPAWGSLLGDDGVRAVTAHVVGTIATPR